MFRIVVQCIVYFLSWTMPSAVLASDLSNSTSVDQRQIILVANPNFEIARQFQSEIRAIISDEPIVAISPKQFESRYFRNPQNIIIAVGPKAFTAISKLATIDAMIPIINVYSTQATYDRLMENTEGVIYSTAIYLDPSPNEQMQLIEGIYGGESKIGILLSRDNQQQWPQLRDAATRANLRPSVELIDDETSLNKAMSKLLAQHVTAVYAVPDHRVFNSANSAEISVLLETSYKHRTPLIGFDTSFVKYGSLASIVYLPKHIAAQTKETIERYRSQSILDRPTYPRKLNVLINRRIAKSLGLYESDPQELTQKILQHIPSLTDANIDIVFYEGGKDAGQAM